jgi:thioesterase domain-containing protein
MGLNSIRKEPSLAIHFQIINVWERMLGTHVNGTDKSFLELGGREDLVPIMLREVQQATGKQVSPADFLRDPTIDHLAQCLVSQVRDDGIFVPVKEGIGVPFYFFHGDILGGGFYSRRLADLLGVQQPVCVSAPIELSEDELPSVEELAACKRDSLQQRQPHGPYVLGGFCVGAVIAYEVARQLEARGEEVRSVVLIEPEIGNTVTRSHQKVVNSIAARKRHPREKVQTFMRGLKKIEHLRHVWQAPLNEKKEFVLRNSRKAITRNSGTSSHSAEEANARPLDASTERDWLISAYHWVLTSYVPKSYRGHVTLLLTDEHLAQAPFVLKQWKKAAPQARVERIPGRHLSCITTHLAAIAEKIRHEIGGVKSLVGMLLPAASSHFWLVEL